MAFNPIAFVLGLLKDVAHLHPCVERRPLKSQGLLLCSSAPFSNVSPQYEPLKSAVVNTWDQGNSSVVVDKNVYQCLDTL